MPEPEGFADFVRACSHRLYRVGCLLVGHNVQNPRDDWPTGETKPAANAGPTCPAGGGPNVRASTPCADLDRGVGLVGTVGFEPATPRL